MRSLIAKLARAPLQRNDEDGWGDGGGGGGPPPEGPAEWVPPPPPAVRPDVPEPPMVPEWVPDDVPQGDFGLAAPQNTHVQMFSKQLVYQHFLRVEHVAVEMHAVPGVSVWKTLPPPLPTTEPVQEAPPVEAAPQQEARPVEAAPQEVPPWKVMKLQAKAKAGNYYLKSFCMWHENLESACINTWDMFHGYLWRFSVLIVFGSESN